MGGLVKEEGIGDNHGSHGLDHRYRTRQHTWVVASARLKRHRLQLVSHCLYRSEQRGHRLEGNPEVDVLTVTYTSLDAA